MHWFSSDPQAFSVHCSTVMRQEEQALLMFLAQASTHVVALQPHALAQVRYVSHWPPLLLPVSNPAP
jgi:hypothetical protein